VIGFAIDAFTLIGCAFCSGVVMGAFSTLFVLVAFSGHMSEAVAFTTLDDSEVWSILLPLEALTIDEEVIDDTPVCSFGIFCENNDRLMSPQPRMFRAGGPSQGLDACDRDIVTVGIFFLPFFNGFFVFDCFVIPGFQIDCPCGYSVDYNPIPRFVNLHSSVRIFPINRGFFDEFCSFLVSNSNTEYASSELGDIF
jgi:hypothetical protein